MLTERLHWLATHGVTRQVAKAWARLGDPQARFFIEPSVWADPLPFFEELRSLGPLTATRMGFMTVDHAVARELHRSDEFRVVSIGANLPAPLRWCERLTRTEVLNPQVPPSLLAVEPPDHTRYRKAVSAVFTARAVAALRDLVDGNALPLLEELAGECGVVDVVDRYCSRLPVTIISDILGVPAHDRARIGEFAELASPSIDFGLSWSRYRSVHRGLAGLERWLAAHLEQLRVEPDESLMSRLIEASGDGVRLNDTEAIVLAGVVLAAGIETAVSLLGNGIRMLLDSPDQLAVLSGDSSLWPNAVEEILRLDPPLQLTARVARTDTTVAGTPVRRGGIVVIYLAAANRDPSVFADPHRFDVRRHNAGQHLAFGGGSHYCLGAPLARMECASGLRSFFTRFPNAQLAGPGCRRDTRVLRGWARLPVRTG